MAKLNGNRPTFMWTTRVVSAIMVDDDGSHCIRKIKQNCVVRGAPPKDFVEFFADITTQVGAMPDGQPIVRQRKGVVVPGKTIGEAFVNLHEMIPEVCKSIRDEAFAETSAGPKQEIVAATELPPGLPPFPGLGMAGPRPRRRR